MTGGPDFTAMGREALDLPARWTAIPSTVGDRAAPAVPIDGLGRGGGANGIDEFVMIDGVDRYLRSLANRIRMLTGRTVDGGAT